jgi:hypothetical protein
MITFGGTPNLTKQQEGIPNKSNALIVHLDLNVLFAQNIEGFFSHVNMRWFYVLLFFTMRIKMVLFVGYYVREL